MTSWTKVLVVSASFALIAFPAITLAQHGHDDGHADLLVGGDSAGVGNLLIDYPFGERPFVRVSDSGAPEGLFTAVDPGFDRAEDEPGEGVFALPAGTEISLEIVALDENIQLTMDNGVDGLGILANPGDDYRIGLISDGVCDLEAVPGTCNLGSGLCTAGQVGASCEDDEDCDQGQCTAGDVGANCSENSDCSTISPDIHKHPEYQLQLIALAGADPDRFAEGDVLFKLTNTDASGYGESAVHKLTLSNGHLPPAEFEDATDNKDRKRRAKCQQAVANEVRKLSADHYKRLAQCMDALVAAEELGGSEKKADDKCSLSTSAKGVVARLEASRAKAIAKIAAKCGDPTLGGSSEPFTLRQVTNHLGMATCRTQDLVAGLYNGSLGMLEGHFSGECDGGSNLCDGGVNDGMACAEDEDCSAEEAIEEALPCLVMSQAAH